MEASRTFKDRLGEKNLEYFNTLTSKTFADQAIAFLNAYWEEIGGQAEFIYTVAYQMFKEADMHAQGTNYIHLYEEGSQLDFNFGLYFFEKLCKKVLDSEEGKIWRDDIRFKVSIPEMKTAIIRKKEMKEKIDVNFNNKISFLEYLLYQYQGLASPLEFTDRSLKMVMEHPEVVKAKDTLKSVNMQIMQYEKQKHELQKLVDIGGVKGMKAKHEISILEAGTGVADLDRSLINAEASVRKVSSQHKAGVEQDPVLKGSLWWIEKEIKVKQKVYSKLKK